MSNCVLTSDKNEVQAMRGFSGVLLILLLFPKYPLFAMEGDSAGACQVDGRAVSFTISDSATIGNVDVSRRKQRGVHQQSDRSRSGLGGWRRWR